MAIMREFLLILACKYRLCSTVTCLIFRCDFANNSSILLLQEANICKFCYFKKQFLSMFFCSAIGQCFAALWLFGCSAVRLFACFAVLLLLFVLLRFGSVTMPLFAGLKRQPIV